MLTVKEIKLLNTAVSTFSRSSLELHNGSLNFLLVYRIDDVRKIDQLCIFTSVSAKNFCYVH